MVNCPAPNWVSRVRFSPMILIMNIMRYIFYKLKYFFQRRFRGWDDRVVYNLDYETFVFLAPRLKRFAELTVTYPAKFKSLDEWKKELNDIVKDMEYTIDNWYSITQKDYDTKKRLINWLHEHLMNLWF